MFDFASLNLGKVDTLVDIGAGVGAFLGPALEFYQPARFTAIEMLPERAAYLRHRFRENPADGCVRQLAVGESRWCTQAIHRTLSADSSSLLPVDPQAQNWFSVMPHGMDQFVCDEASVYPMDDIHPLPDYKQIDLMKIDVQGYEGRAIRGGQATLKRTRALIIEVLFCHHYEGQSTPEEIDGLLTGLGFRLDRWLTDDWNADHTVHLQGDALYRMTI